PVSTLEKRFHVRYSTRSASANFVDGRAAWDYIHKFPKSLLEHRAATCSSHRERLQPRTRRFTCQRHHQRRDRRIARLHVGVDLARRESIKTAKWRNAQMARRRRHAHHHRLVPGRRLSHWLRRSKRTRVACGVSRCVKGEDSPISLSSFPHFFPALAVMPVVAEPL